MDLDETLMALLDEGYTSEDIERALARLQGDDRDQNPIDDP